MTLNILCIGDVIGKPGRMALFNRVSSLQREHKIDFTILNVENSASGNGITPRLYGELTALPIQAFTSGNHIYSKKEIIPHFDECERLIRPLNFPPGNPGTGFRFFKVGNTSVAVVNLIGRVFMGLYDCPFQAMERYLPELRAKTPIIIVDFHAEATSEKMAMGWYLNGHVSGVYGTHTHVQTADERILDRGTAFISDVGMVGPRNSVLGVQIPPVLHRFFTAMPAKFEPAEGPCIFSAVKMTVEKESGRATHIQRILEVVG